MARSDTERNEGGSGDIDVGGREGGDRGGQGREAYACAWAGRPGGTGRGGPGRGFQTSAHGGVGREWSVGEHWDGVAGMRVGGDQPVGLGAGMVGGSGVHNHGP
jgi:hypothetical protein